MLHRQEAQNQEVQQKMTELKVRLNKFNVVHTERANDHVERAQVENAAATERLDKLRLSEFSRVRMNAVLLSKEAQAAYDRKLIQDMRMRKIKRRTIIELEVKAQARRDQQTELLLNELRMRSKRAHARRVAAGSLRKASEYSEMMKKIRAATGVQSIGSLDKDHNRDERIKRFKSLFR